MTLLEDNGFKRSQADPCLAKKIDKNGKVYLGVHVDDASCVGDKLAIREALTSLKEKVSIKELGPFSKYLGCEVLQEGDKVWITQPSLIKKIEEKFTTKIGTRTYDTPAIPGTSLQRTKDDNDKLDVDDHKNFRSGVGMLLYLVKNSRPDIANAVRELTKVMDKPNKDHEKALYRAIRYVLDTKYKSLCFDTSWKSTSDKWILGAYSDSTYASDPDKKVSVTGFIITLEGMLLSWKSRSQKSVTLSSTEAEYVAVSETCQEIIAIKQIIKFLDIEIKLPIEIKVDNVGAIYLANNQMMGQRTRHVNIRFHYVRQYIEDGIIIIEFVRSEDNQADTWTKNLDGETYHKHVDNYVTTRPSKQEGCWKVMTEYLIRAYQERLETNKLRKTRLTY